MFLLLTKLPKRLYFMASMSFASVGSTSSSSASTVSGILPSGARPLTDREAEELRIAFLNSGMVTEMHAAYKKSMEDSAQAVKSLTTDLELLREAREHALKAQEAKNKAQEARTAAQEARSKAEEHKERGDKIHAEVESLKKQALGKDFIKIFNKSIKLSPAQYEVIFNTYLTDDSLFVGKNSQGKNCPKIRTMTSVIKYLNDNPNIETCDFIHFKDEIDKFAIEKLAEHLKTSPVKEVVFISSISTIANQYLNPVVTARAATPRPLTIRYRVLKTT